MQNSKITFYNGIANTNEANFNLLYFNARSLRNKFMQVESFLSANGAKYSVVVVTETWLNKNELNYFNLRDYQSFHSVRDDPKISRGGGVSIFIHNSFDKANEIGNKYWNGNNCLMIELLQSKTKILGFYRQPNNKNDADGSIFINELNYFLSSFKNCYILGDFNFNLFDQDSSVEKYKDTIMLNDFQIVNSSSIEYPTRINYNTKTVSCIDHIFTDQLDEEKITKGVLSYFDLVADHKALCLSLWVENQKKNEQTVFKFSVVNNQRIASEKFFESLSSSNFDELALDIKQIIDNNITEITRRNKTNKPYINSEILTYIKIKRNYEKLKRKYPTSSYVHDKWKFYRNKVANLCLKAKKRFVDNFFCKNAHDPRKVWQQINLLLGKKPKNESDDIHMLFDNNCQITDKKIIANTLNHHYVNISRSINCTNKISRINILNYHRRQNINIEHEFACPECTIDEVKVIINNLKNTNATDVFGISNNFMKIHCESLAPIITKLINKHMYEGNFPEALKFSIVRPIYKKKGSKTDKNSYRPVSLTCILSKIFESVIYRRLHEHCNLNHFFGCNQFGYQEKSCPESAMIHAYHEIYDRINKKKLLTALLTIDLTSAFDCIDHEILLTKLTKLQLPPYFIKLMQSYLSNRSQVVKVGDILSEICRVYCGSPQGGVLSGLLFNIYVNSIFLLSLKGHLILYCDDMSLISSGRDMNQLKNDLEYDLLLIDSWLDLHYLKANFSKTNYVLFSGRKRFENFTERSLNLMIKGICIERVEYVKIVGLLIDESLNFSNQVDNVKKKVVPFVAKLAKIRKFLSEKTALSLYYANVYSHLIFMNSIWSVAPKYLTESIGVIQRRALRIVFMKDRLCSNKDLFSDKILPFSAICEFHQNLIMFKILHNKFKNNVNLRLVNETHNFNTRSSARNDVNVDNSISGIDFYYRAAKSYNMLPENIRKFQSINLFKTRLKEYLYDSYIKE